jgi:hypothetical protein
MSPSAIGAARRAFRLADEWRTARQERRFKTRLRHDPGAPELVVSPHLDDAVLDCWSVLSSDRELNVVTVFAGVPPASRVAIWDEITGAADSAERVRARLDEDARAMARANREPHNLSLLDAQYRTGRFAPALDDVDRAICERVPSASRIYVPAGIGRHADHLLARGYGRLLAHMGFPVTVYAELPYCIAHGWPAWVDGREPDPYRNVDAHWMSFLEDLEELPPLRSGEVVRLEAPVAEAKLAAMRCYETQLPCLSYGARGLLEDPAIHGFEVSWELRAAAQGATG